MRPLGKVLLFSLLLTSLPAEMGRAQSGIMINEVMAANTRTTDPQGQYDDWIELYNTTDAWVNLAGMYLTDDLANPTKWRIEGKMLIPGQGYLVIWADGDTGDSGFHAGFRLSSDGETLGLFAADGTTLVDSLKFGPQYANVSYGRCPDGTETYAYMGLPSPGAANHRPFDGVVADPEFSSPRGFYDAPFDVTLTCATPGATIYFTVDGSDPAGKAGSPLGGTVYTGPIRIRQTTCLRAVAAKGGWLSSRSNAQTYIFLSDIITQPATPAGFPATWGSAAADYQMDPDVTNAPAYKPLMRSALLSLPTLSITMNTEDLFGSDGIYANPSSRGRDWERPASVELIDPNGPSGFQINCGIQVQGDWFRPLDRATKKSFRLVFKGLYGPTRLRYPLFGNDAADEFETITLRGGANDGYTWDAARYTEQYTRDQFGRDLQRATGNAGAHGMFVHLYLNGLYWGLYNPCERPDASFSASYYGGAKEDWDVLHANGSGTEPVEGDMTIWNQMIGLCSAGDAFYRLQGLNPDGTRNPAYPVLLDMSNYIDYVILNLWGGNWDWPGKNWYVARARTADSTGFKFYCWDYENTMGNNLSRSPLNMVTPDRGLNGTWNTGVGIPHNYLRTNAEYKLLFADRVHRFFFNHGVLTPESLIPRYTVMADTVQWAIVGESARWGDQHYHPPLMLDDWLDSDTNYNDGRAGRGWIVNYYLPARTGVVLQQLKSAGLYPNINAPVFNINGAYQHGGHAPADAALALQATTGAIWYTLDGNDPRTPGSGAVGGSVTLVAQDTPKKVCVPTAALDDAWKGGAAFDDSAWTSGAGGVGYENGSGYESYFSLDVGAAMYQKNTTCYIRIPFTVAAADVGRFSSLTLSLYCDDGFIAYINGVEVARKNCTGTPAWNSKASTQTSDADAVILTAWSAAAGLSALRAGENILALQGLNDKLDSSDFLIAGQLTGSTVSKYTTPIPLTKSTVVKARALSGATWSALNEAVYAVGPVTQNLRVSEVMYHPLDPNCEFVELTNIGPAKINLNLVQFTKGISFTFGDVELAPHAYTLVVEDPAAFKARYGDGLPVAGRYTGNLSNGGERLELRDAVGTVIESFRYEDKWYPLTDGKGYSLTVKTPDVTDPNRLSDKDSWQLSALGGGSPGYDDSVAP